MVPEPEEKDSLLKGDHRSYLENPLLEGDKDRKFRERMRNQVRRGLGDFFYLNRLMREDDIRQIFYGDFWRADIFDQDSQSNRELNDLGVHQDSPILGVREMVEFAYRGLRLQGVSPAQIYKLVLRDAIRFGEAKHRDVEPRNIRVFWRGEGWGGTLDVEVVEPDGMDPLEKWEKGMPLSGDDVKALQERGTFEPDE